MPITEKPRRGLKLFSRKDAPDLHDTTMQPPPDMDEAAQAALPEFFGANGSMIKLLFGDPDTPGGGGLSLVRSQFKSNYPLPRHSHDVDCLYYVVAGELHMGNRIVGAGEGFFVPADAPYGYVAGPEGVEVLEFRATSYYRSRLHETGWDRIVESVRSNREAWAAQESPA